MTFLPSVPTCSNMGDSPDNPDGLPWESEADAPDAPSAAELEEAGQEAMFGAEQTPAPADHTYDPHASTVRQPAQPYRVLARKYRPQTFAELIGQEAMVRTLANAIARDRLAHAFLMTGVRGVGKTSTARLIALDEPQSYTLTPPGPHAPVRAAGGARPEASMIGGA